MGQMEITFPQPPDSDVDEVSEFYDVFTPGYAYFTAEYMPFPMSGFLDSPEELLDYARFSGESAVEDGMLESFTAAWAAEGVAMFQGVDAASNPLSEFSDLRNITRSYFTMNGVYVIHSNNTPEGQTFLDSIVFPDAAPAPEALSIPEEAHTV